MYLKVIERSTGGFRMIEVSSASFRRLEEPCVVYREIGYAEEQRLVIESQVFLLNDVGDNIDSFNAFQHTRKVGTS